MGLKPPIIQPLAQSYSSGLSRLFAEDTIEL
jgi:hypothetical protein